LILNQFSTPKGPDQVFKPDLEKINWFGPLAGMEAQLRN
jgi:hypothetical protein